MVSHVWLFLTLNLINGLRASVYQMTALPSCVCLEFSRKQKKCVACSQWPMGHFILQVLGLQESHPPLQPISTVTPGDTQWWWPSVNSWGHAFSCRCTALPSCLLGRGLWLVLAASAKGWPRLCGWGPGFCSPETPFMLPFLLSSVWGPHALQYAFWFPRWLLSLLVGRTVLSLCPALSKTSSQVKK